MNEALLDKLFEKFVTTGSSDGITNEFIVSIFAETVAEKNAPILTKAHILASAVLASRADMVPAEAEARAALSLLSEANLAEYEPLIHANLGFICSSLGRTSEAILELGLALQQTSVTPESYARVRALTVYAGIVTDFGDVVRGVELYRESLELCRSLQLTRTIASVLYHLAGIYMLTGNFEAAIEMSQEATREAQNANSDIWVCFSTVREATALLELHRYEEVLTRLVEIEPMLVKLNLGDLLGTVALVQGKAYRLLLRFDDGRRSFSLAMATFRKLQNPRLLANAIVLFSELEIDTGAFAQAEELLQESHKISADLEEPYGISSSLEAFATLYRKKGDFERAFEYLEKHQDAKKRVVSTEGERRSQLFRIEREVEKKEQERELYRMKSEKAEQDLALQATALAAQTELLARFRDELRQIVREIDDPLNALKKIKERLKTLPCQEVDWVKFEQDFVAVHPEFRKKLKEKYPVLSNQELRLCQLLRTGLKSHEAARLMCITERGVETHRLRIRRKLGIRGSASLTEFLQKL